MHFGWAELSQTTAGEAAAAANGLVDFKSEAEATVPVDVSAGAWLGVRICSSGAILLALASLWLQIDEMYTPMLASSTGVLLLTIMTLVLNALTSEHDVGDRLCELANELEPDSCEESVKGWAIDDFAEVYAFFVGALLAFLVAAFLAPLSVILTLRARTWQQYRSASPESYQLTDVY